ncbi:MAG: NrsF family protein [Bacteriovoracaceae bacterium]
MSEKIKKTNNDLLNSLVEDLKPVSPLWSAEKRTLIWMFTQTFFSVLAMVLVSPMNKNFISDFSKPAFFLQYTLFMSSAFICGYFSFQSVIPGSYSFKKNKFLYGLVGLLLISLLMNSNVDGRIHRLHCESEVFLYSIISFISLFFFLRKGFLQSNSLVFSILAVSLLPAGLMHLACLADAKHVFLCHLMPAGALFLAVKTTSYFYRKRL